MEPPNNIRMDTTAVVLPYAAYAENWAINKWNNSNSSKCCEENKIEFCASMIGSMTKYKSYILVNGGEYLSFNKGM